MVPARRKQDNEPCEGYYCPQNREFSRIHMTSCLTAPASLYLTSLNSFTRAREGRDASRY